MHDLFNCFSCNYLGEDFVNIRHKGTHKTVYELLDFSFDDDDGQRLPVFTVK